MKAVVCHDFGDAEVVDIPRPAPAAGEVLVAVERVQLSVTECLLYEGVPTSPSFETVRERLAAGEARLFGHEFCGSVVEVGDGVETFEPGDRVYAPGKVPCHDCPHCNAGHRQFCEHKATIGLDIRGTLAEYVALPTEPLSKLPDDISPAAGAAMQPVTAAMIGVLDAPLVTGDVVATVGTGVMGYASAQFARLEGAGDVLAIDIDDRKLELAAAAGLHPVNATETDPVAAVEEYTDGIGADVTFEAVGGDQDHATEGTDPVAQAYQMTRPGGTVVQVGYITGDVTLTPRAMKARSVDWLNPPRWKPSLGPNADGGTLAPKLVAEGRVSIDPFITHEFEGLDHFEEAIEVTMNPRENDALGPAQLVLTG